MNWFEKYKIAIVSVLMPALLILAGNAVFNWHVHKSSDGSLIVHAHPFNKADHTSEANNDSNETHKHDSKECFSIKQLTNFMFVCVNFAFGGVISDVDDGILTAYDANFTRNQLIKLLPNRAPPYFKEL